MTNVLLTKSTIHHFTTTSNQRWQALVHKSKKAHLPTPYLSHRPLLPTTLLNQNSSPISTNLRPRPTSHNIEPHPHHRIPTPTHAFPHHPMHRLVPCPVHQVRENAQLAADGGFQQPAQIGAPRNTGVVARQQMSHVSYMCRQGVGTTAW